MQVLLLFMLGVFVVSGPRLGSLIERRPILLMALSVLVAGSFYSLRVLQ